MKQTPDMISTTGKFVNMTSGIPFEGNASNGEWYYNNVTKQLTYIVSGRGETGLVNRQVKLKVSLVCFFAFFELHWLAYTTLITTCTSLGFPFA